MAFPIMIFHQKGFLHWRISTIFQSAIMNFFIALITSFCVLNNLFLPLADAVDPTDGFDNIPLIQNNFKLQRPYDVPLEERYSFENGTHRLWVYADDKPHDPNSPTQPRTEIRIHVCRYFLCFLILDIIFVFSSSIPFSFLLSIIPIIYQS